MIYLDYNASTPIDPKVAAAMRPFLDEAFGNPSSGHWASVPAKNALENARRQVASLLCCAPDEVVFTSGGSEANNLAIKGTFFALRDKGEHIVTTQIEHPAVLGPCRFLERLGARVTYLPVDGYGRVDPEDVRRAITARTILITVIHANNEVGTIQPLAKIGAIAREHGIRFHTDAAQSIGKIPVHVAELGVDLLTVVGHKFYAPKGVGALYVRRNVALEPLIHGGGHERGLRSGTESALLTVGLGEACSLAMDLEPMERIRALRDRLWHGLRADLRRCRRLERPPGTATAQHSECLIRRQDWRRHPCTPRRGGRLDRLGLSLRSGGALARPVCNESARAHRDGRGSLQPWSGHDRN